MRIFSLRINSAPLSGLLLFNPPRLVCQSIFERVPVDGNARNARALVVVLGGSV
jgi:hypothetical protein